VIDLYQWTRVGDLADAAVRQLRAPVSSLVG
jgi:hypothetical protein